MAFKDISHLHSEVNTGMHYYDEQKKISLHKTTSEFTNLLLTLFFHHNQIFEIILSIG